MPDVAAMFGVIMPADDDVAREALRATLNLNRPADRAKLTGSDKIANRQAGSMADLSIGIVMLEMTMHQVGLDTESTYYTTPVPSTSGLVLGSGPTSSPA